MAENQCEPLTFERLREAVAGTAAALRCRTRLQPASGPGTKVFPPTYAGAVYAVEQRRVPGHDEPVTCVLLDSVQSQANRMEEALQDAVDEGRIRIPLIVVDFSEYYPGNDKPEDLRLLDPVGRVTSLQAPHRLADAILRDSEYDGKPFRQSELGSEIDQAKPDNATPLYRLCPTALVFGMWDSTGPKGGLGAKFERAMVSEIVGVNASFGVKTSSRIDPLGIRKEAATIYERDVKDDNDAQIEWTLDPELAKKDSKGKPKKFSRGTETRDVGTPAKINHGNVTPSFDKYAKGAEGPDVMTAPEMEVSYRISTNEHVVDHSNRLVTRWPDAKEGRIAPGGVTVEYADHTTVLSLAVLRRLRFPLEGNWHPSDEQRARDAAARTVLAALALCAAELAAERGFGYGLRSRCLLWPDEPRTWELLDTPGCEPKKYRLDGNAAVGILRRAVAEAEKAGLEWHSDVIYLKPHPELVRLVKKSQELAIQQGGSETTA